jgi:serine protease
MSLTTRVPGLVVAAIAAVEGVRTRKASDSMSSKVKMISGVKVYNFDKAFDANRWDPDALEEMGASLASDQERWVVVDKKGTSEQDIEKMCSRHVECEGHGHATGIPYVQLKASLQQLEAFVAEEKNMIEFIEPNLPMSLFPDIMEVDNQADVPWGIRRIRTRQLDGMPSGNPSPANGGEGVNAYVLDTGVRLTHNDFGGRAKPFCETWLMFFIRDCRGSSGGCSEDGNGHGTHCAGTIAGTNYGVAPKATVYSAKVLADSGAGSSIGIMAAMDFVASKAQRPAVASMSLGGARSAGYDSAVAGMTDAGVVVVTASGNSDADGCGFSPGSAPAAINVGSLDDNDARSSFSNYGNCLDIWAPGRNVLSAWFDGDDATKSISGTSMACPHVSGAVAILLQKSPSLTAEQVKQQLAGDATPGLVTDAKAGSPNLILYSAA